MMLGRTDSGERVGGMRNILYFFHLVQRDEPVRCAATRTKKQMDLGRDRSRIEESRWKSDWTHLKMYLSRSYLSIIPT